MRKEDIKYLAEERPDLLEQWDWELNKDIDISTVPLHTDKEVWWKCLNHPEHPSFLAKVSKRTRKIVNDKNKGCPICGNKIVVPGLNDLASQYPDIAAEWDFEKNEFSPEEYAYDKHVAVWWKCSTCGHSWKAHGHARTQLGTGCPVCARVRTVPGINDMATLYPELVERLHPTLNGDFDPKQVSISTREKLFWQCCDVKEHIFQSKPYDVLKGSRCPICSGRQVLQGCNDLESQFPELMDEWDWEKNQILPSEIYHGSNKKVHWKCHKGHEWEARICERTKGHTGCPHCFSGSSSFVEWFMFYACQQAFQGEPVFHRDTTLGFELDVFVPSRGFAIEPGSWYWHQNKTAKDWRKRRICANNQITLHVVYFDYVDEVPPSKKDGLWPWGCYHITQSLGPRKIEELIAVTVDILEHYTQLNDSFDWEAVQSLATAAMKNGCDKSESLGEVRSELLAEWDYDKNIISPYELVPYSGLEVWWKCQHGHSYLISPSRKYPGCPWCRELLLLLVLITFRTLSKILQKFGIKNKMIKKSCS